MIDAARGVGVPAECDVAILGGGAAGLAAAISAAQTGASTVVIERDVICGRPILATGNGRCNFTNASLAADVYRHPDFVAETFGAHPLDDVLGLFRGCGMAWACEDDRLYPLSRVAASVRDVLIDRCADAGVTLAAARAVSGVERRADGWHVSYEGPDPAETGLLSPKAIVIATGGGSSHVVAGLGLALVDDSPVLCPIACDAPFLPELDGRRAQAMATLRRGDDVVTRERGEVLFRERGLSGIVIFDLSRLARPGDVIELDLIPDLEEDAVVDLLSPVCERHGGRPGAWLSGVLDPSVAAVVGELADATPTDGKDDLSHAAIRIAKALPLRVSGLMDVERAQVTRGGLDVHGFEPSSLECISSPGLFACGEAVDVDGPCGGFNLSWAWKSGMVAGTHAAAAARGERR